MRFLSKISFVSFIEYIWVFLIVLECNTVYIHITAWHLDLSIYIMGVTSFLFIMLSILYRRTSAISLTFVSAAVLYLIYMLFFALLNNDSIEFIYKYLIFIPLVSMIFIIKQSANDSQSTIFKLADIVFFLAALSLIFWCLCSILQLLPYTSTVSAKWNTIQSIKSFSYVYFEAQESITFLGIDVLRNTGIFIEAPKYCICLLFSLLTELFLKPRFSKFKVTILALTILSTFASYGIIVLMCSIFLKLVVSKRIKRPTKIFAMPVIFILVIIGIQTLVSDKSVSGSSSFNVHLDDFIAGFKAWQDHIFIGNGYNSMDRIWHYMSTFRRNNTGFSNSIMQVLAQGGLWLFSVYLTAFISGFALAKNRHDWRIFSFTLMTLLMFIGVIFSYRFILLLFVAYFFSLNFTSTKTACNAVTTI